MKKINFLLLILFVTKLYAQLPSPAMVGYWEAWDYNDKLVTLDQIDDRYNVICIAFAQYNGGKDYDVKFTPPKNYTEQEFKDGVKALQDQGKKVLISLGGETTPHVLDNANEKDVFVSSMNTMIDYWGFDGLDIDLEGGSVHYTDINIEAPGDVTQQLFIEALREILDNHQSSHNEKLLLTMAPETMYVQGALSPWANEWNVHKGAYLPIIEAFKDDIDMLNVQLYNSGSMYGLDGPSGGEFSQGTPDFVLALTEAAILGFTAENEIGTYSGLPANRVGVALPGCHSSDALPHEELEATMRYLIGEGPQPGKYTLKTEGGYPDLRGMMTWSINSDKFCSPSYGFVNTYDKVFGTIPYISISNPEKIYEGAEDGKEITVELFRSDFAEPLDINNWSVGNLPEGVVLGSVTRVSDSKATITLNGNATNIETSYPFARSNTSVSINKADLIIQEVDSVFSNTGVLLKKYPRIIPGTIEGESFENFHGVKRHSTNAAYWQGEWAEYEIDVQSGGDYIIDFRLTSSLGTDIKINIALDGSTITNASLSSKSGFNVYENYEFQTALTEGIHTLKITSSKEWFHIDYISLQPGVVDGLSGYDTANETVAFFYPNPAQTKIHLNTDSQGQLNIYNMNGMLMKKIDNVQGSEEINIDDLENGMYLLELNNEKGLTIRYKLIKN
jgi:chitinase